MQTPLLWKPIRKCLLLKATMEDRKKVLRFLLVMGLCYALLSGLHEWLKTTAFLSQLDLMTYAVSQLANFFFQPFSQSSGVFPLWEGYLLSVEGRALAYVGYTCNGWGVTISFLSLMSPLFPELGFRKWISKVLLGVCTILVINGLRVFLLGLLYKSHPELVEFNHKFTFTVIVYGAILLYYYRIIRRMPLF